MFLMLLMLLILFPADRLRAQSSFAARVMDYDPAPGQWVNNVNFNDPTAALGEPFPGGLPKPIVPVIVTLGGFGGSITLGFDHTVEDHRFNPFGMDAVVFGNAFWPTDDPNAHWAENATIEISLDANGNGLADDPWYLIPGSHISDPVGQWTVMTWDDNPADATYPPALGSWIPPNRSGRWISQAYALPADPFAAPIVVNPATGYEGIFGYAEYTPTMLLGDMDGDRLVDDPAIAPADFYTVPDNPLTIGVTPGSGGGDAFDIAWAIDPMTSEPAGLSGFDFIRLTTAVHVVAGPLGEKSAEIDAVADVKPDPFGHGDDDGDIDLPDLADFQVCFGVVNAAAVGCDRFDRQPDEIVDWRDAEALMPRITGPR